jgi:ELWxxDGT repeat protein
MESLMPAKRILSAALALLLVAAIPARATSVPTLTVVEINPGSGSSSAMDNSESAALDGYLYFTATDGDSGYELWRTNGEVTELVKEIRSGGSGSYPYYFTALSGYLYFRANDGTSGNELWRTDGTEAGTTRVKDINSSAGGSSNPGGFTAFNGHLYFQAYDSTNGFELWRTDGTEAGTTRVMDINLASSGADGSYPDHFTALGDYLYFRADDGTNGFELWRTDGTEAGTTRVKDINSGGYSSYPDDFTALGDYLYFQANDGTRTYVYRTDGTATEHVPFPVAGQSINCACYDTSIIAVGARLYTTVYSDAIGNEFAYLDEPTYVLPPTNRDGSLWTTTLVILAGLTAAASIGLRVRGAKRT